MSTTTNKRPRWLERLRRGQSARIAELEALVAGLQVDLATEQAARRDLIERLLDPTEEMKEAFQAGFTRELRKHAKRRTCSAEAAGCAALLKAAIAE